MKVLALDIGDKWTGVAIGDTAYKLALPYSVIKSTTPADLVDQIELLVKSESIERVVVGMPKLMSGQLSDQTIKTTDLVRLLTEKIKVEVVTFDERLTTRRAQVPADLPKRQVDEVAAMYLLQDYLEQINLA